MDPSDSVTFNGYTKSVWIGGSFVSQKFYDVISTATAPAYRLSKDAYEIESYIYNHGIPGAIFIPNFSSTINADYFKPEKQAYLKYVYGYQQLPPYQVLDSLQTQFLLSRISYYSGDQASYTTPFNPNIVTNLYLASLSMVNNYFDTLSYILNTVSADNPISPGHTFFDTNKVVVLTTPDSPLIAYRCADGTYWYRYFGAHDTLYNVYVSFPAYIPMYDRVNYQIIGGSLGVSTTPGIAPAMGDSTTRFFTLNLKKPGDPTIIQANGLTTFTIGRNVELDNVLLGQPITGTPIVPPTDTFNNCERSLLNSAVAQGIINYNNYIDSIKLAITASFTAYMMDSAHEKLMLNYLNDEFDYTLYNYDRAANLISTVPPMGVQPIPISIVDYYDTARANNTYIAPPSYTKSNTYNYNTINKVVQQATIDGGSTFYFYDAAARLILSQNSKQSLTGDYSYNIYDQQNRVIETGQATLGAPISASFSYDSFVNYIRTFNRVDVVMSIFDTAAANLAEVSGLSAQQNLRKRIAAVKYFDTLAATDTLLANYIYATHYSYDMEGNVNMLVQDFPALATLNQRYKRIDYDYDLISGKVNLLSYNRSFSDQFYQRYSYDADNRITQVQTSNDGYVWTQDAAYTYYEHGPLARIDLGDLRVQGIDYAYTIQGWMKSVNGDTLNPNMDMGRDGSVGGPINASDAVSYTIDYFSNDYKPITSWQMQHVPVANLSLYNGNISRQTVAIDTLQRLTKQYIYDQLNRIKSATYSFINPIDNTLTGLTDFHNSYKYDQDGNLLSLIRYGNNLGGGAMIMDSLTYEYSPSSAYTDRLTNVADCAPNNYSNDIPNFCPPPGSSFPVRYLYDPVGNTIADLVSGQNIIEWNIYNKVIHTVDNADTSSMRFVYDGLGNRVAKSYSKINSSGQTIRSDYYIHDAQGNIMAIYHAHQIFDSHGDLKSNRIFLSPNMIYTEAADWGCKAISLCK